MISIQLKKYSFTVAAFLIPLVVYFWVILGWSVGEDCGAGIKGIIPSGITNYLYCQQQADTGAYSWQHIAHWHLVATDWLSGVLPLWNPHQGLGVPLVANFISGAFSPLLILFNMVGSLLITRWYLVLRLSLASLGMYLCLRQLKYKAWPSLAGASLYVLNGYITQFFSINHHDVDFFLPWLIICAIKAKQKRIWWSVSAVLICLSIFAGMPESNIFLFGIYGLFSIWLGWSLPHRDKIVYYLNFLASTMIGLALSAILLFPGWEFVTHAFQSRLIGLGNIYTTSFKNIVFWILPRIFGLPFNILTQNQSLGILNINHFGFTVTIIVIASVVTEFRFTSFVLLILLAQYFGFIHFPLDRLPIIKDTIFVKYSLETINFLAAIEMTRGIPLWLTKVNKKRVFFILAWILVMSILLINQDIKTALNGRYLWQAKGTFYFILIQSFLAIFLLIPLIKSKKEWLISMLVIVELSLYLPWVGSRLHSTQIVTPTFVGFLQEHNDGSRIFSPDGILYPDYASYFRLNDIRDIDAMWPDDYYQYIKRYIQPDMDLAFLHFGSAQDSPVQHPAKIINNPYFDELAVKYLISYESTESSQLKKVFDDKVKVYENMKAFPRAWFVSNLICTKDDEKVFDNLSGHLKDTAVQSGNSCDNLRNLPVGKITNSQFLENKITFDYESTASGYLVMSDTYYPGWVATVNGQETNINKVNMTLRGINVPASNHGEIVIEYKPESFYRGGVVSIAGVLSLIVLIISSKLRFL